jgi:hypothetical protein
MNLGKSVTMNIFWSSSISLFHVLDVETHPEVTYIANNILGIPASRTRGYLLLYRPQSSVVTQTPFTQMLAILVWEIEALVCSDGPGNPACPDTTPQEIWTFSPGGF